MSLHHEYASRSCTTRYITYIYIHIHILLPTTVRPSPPPSHRHHPPRLITAPQYQSVTAAAVLSRSTTESRLIISARDEPDGIAVSSRSMGMMRPRDKLARMTFHSYVTSARVPDHMARVTRRKGWERRKGEHL